MECNSKLFTSIRKEIEMKCGERKCAALAVASLWWILNSGTLCAGGRPEGFGGGVVLAGGSFYGNETEASVEAIGTDQLPSLPSAVIGNSLSAVGSVLYSCGGLTASSVSVSDCYVLDSDDCNPSWSQNFSLPEPMSKHSAATVGSHIWFFGKKVIHDLDTNTMTFKTHDATFSSGNGQCAVSNDTHSYLLGGGNAKTEIFVNTKARDPSAWTKVGDTPWQLIYAGCLWIDDYIFVTGGLSSASSTGTFAIGQNKFNAGPNLVQERANHQMFVFNGTAAVVGGLDQNPLVLNTIEVFTGDSFTSQWTSYCKNLLVSRAEFGLAQIE